MKMVKKTKLVNMMYVNKIKRTASTAEVHFPFERLCV